MKRWLFEKKRESKTENKEIREEDKIAIKNQLRQLFKMDQREFASYQMSLDPIKDKIPEGEREEIIRRSILCGQEAAIALREKFGNLSLLEIANESGIIVEYEKKPSALDFVYFGLYETPNHIFIYDDNIDVATSLFHELSVPVLKVDFKEVVLAHEIFHFIEEHDKTLYSNTKKIKLWSLGGFYTHFSPLICTGEIAAMSFAKTILNLEFDPNILDYMFLSAFHFEKADKLFHRMIKFHV